MAATATISKDDVQQAIAGLQERRINPSVRTIRRALGNRGSNELIMRFRGEILGVPDKTDEAKPPTNLMLRIQDVAPELWRAAVGDARAAVAADLKRLDEQLRLSQGQTMEAAQLLAETQQQLTQERSERERLAQTLTEQAQATALVADRQTGVEQGLVRHGDAIADLRSTISGEGEVVRSLLIEAQGRWAAEAAAWATRTAEDHRRMADLQGELARAQVDAAASRQAATAASEREALCRREMADVERARRDAVVAAERIRAEATAATATAATTIEHQKATISSQASLVADLRGQSAEQQERLRLNSVRIEKLGADLATALATLAVRVEERDALVTELGIVRDHLAVAIRDGHTGLATTLDLVLGRLDVLMPKPPTSEPR